MTKTIHPDWEPYDTDTVRYDGPMDDFVQAIENAVFTTPTPIPEIADTFTVSAVEHIERAHVSYHGETWKPGDPAGTELDMCVLGQLNDGRWFGLEAGNDYTGWGCRDFADITAGTRDEVIRHGLTDSACRKLGLPTTQANAALRADEC